MTSRLTSWVVTHIHESIGAPGILNIVCSIYQTCWFGRCIFDFNYGIILGIYGEFQGGKNDHTLSPRNTSPWLAGSPFHPTLLNSNVNRPSEKRVFFVKRGQILVKRWSEGRMIRGLYPTLGINTYPIWGKGKLSTHNVLNRGYCWWFRNPKANHRLKRIKPCK